ncbi:MAG: hypothetical protein ACSW8I_04085 [bacterium]
MKKVFFAFAIASMFGFAACGSNNTETVDTLAEEVATVEEATEEIMDTTAVEAAAVEEVVTEAVAE